MKVYINRVLLVSAVLVSANVLAQCPPGDAVNPIPILTKDKMIVASAGADSWNEVQCDNGRLWDQKQGAGHPTDPSEYVGTWTMTSSGVTHIYGPDQVYNYVLKQAGESYCLDGDQDFPITLVSAPGNSCP